MATKNLGKVAFVFKGDYSDLTPYDKYDVVFDGESSFLSTIENNLGHPLSDSNYWKYLCRGSYSTLGTHINNLNNPHSVTKAQVGLGNADNTSDAEKPISSATQTALNLKENTSNKGAINGYASLDETGKVTIGQLPSYVDDVLEYANLASFPVSGVQGKIYVALDTNKTYRWSGSAYIYITSGAVDSVAGKTGVVSLVKGDVGLGNVDNTSDANKPVSTAQQTALNLKADKARQVIAGSGLTGGGTLESDRTINVTATDDSIVVAADGIKVDTQDNVAGSSTTKPVSQKQAKLLNDGLVQVSSDLNNIFNTIQMLFGKRMFDNLIGTTLFVNKNRINSLGQKETSDRWRLTNPINLNKGQTIYSYSADSGAGLNAIILTNASESFYTPIAPIMTSGYGVYKYTAINDCYVMLQSDGQNSQGVKYCGVIISDEGVIDDIKTLEIKIDAYVGILEQTSSDCSSISNAEFLASEQYNIDEFGYGTVNASWRKIDINLLTGQTVLLWGATGGGAASMISKSTEIVNRYTPLIVYHSNVSKWHKYTATENMTVTLCSQYTRNPYVIITYDSNRLFDIEQRLTELESNDTSIFSFNPEKDVKIKLENANLKYGIISSGSISRQRSPLTLCHFSDLHADSVNLARIIEFKQKYQTYINDILSTGDSVSNLFSDSFSFWASSGANNVLNTLGNHDAFDAGGVLRSQIDCYSKYFTPFIANWGVVQPSGASESGYCYYYKDYAQQGVRLIVLNDQHYDSIQETWLESVLTSAKNNSLAVIIAQHYQAGLANAVNCTFNSNDYNDKVVDLLTPPAEKVDNFIASGGEFVCWLSGHTHNDKFGTLINYPLQVQIAVENAGCDSGWNDDARILGTKSQDCFNIIAIDTHKKEIKLLRIGADYDRQLRHKGTLCYNYSTKTLISNS